VTAHAGSGKTHVLSQRVVRLLLDAGAKVDIAEVELAAAVQLALVWEG
jgi:ATP-dependent exoDNAse (exonuclease V) beta subunit